MITLILTTDSIDMDLTKTKLLTKIAVVYDKAGENKKASTILSQTYKIISNLFLYSKSGGLLC